MGDTSKVHPSGTMASSEMPMKEKDEKLESDFGLDEKKDEEKKEPAEMVPYSELFRYATGKDKLSLCVAVIAAIGTGASMPLMFIIFSAMTDSFTVFGGLPLCLNSSPNSDGIPINLVPMLDGTTWLTTNTADFCKDSTLSDQFCFPNSPTNASWVGVATKNNDTSIMKDDFYCMCFDVDYCSQLTSMPQQELLDDFVYKALEGTLSILETMRPYAIFYTVFGIGTWICGWIQTWFLMDQASNQMQRIRSKFFDSILRQDIGFFDTNSAGELNTRLADDIKKISDGMGDKIGITVQSVARFIAGFVIAFIYGWKLALVIMSIFPVLMVSAIIMFKVTTSFTEKELDAYATAGGIAEEVLSGIKTVTAFSGQQEEQARYNKHLKVAKSVGIKKNISTGFSLGTLFLVLFSAYGLGFWYGGKLIVGEGYTIGDVMLVFFAMLTGAFSLSAAGNNVEVFAKSRVAAFQIFKLIDRESPIDPLSTSGKMVDKNIKPEITFKDVCFTYPAREDQQILFKVSFKAEVGKTLALCGQSGSGKSTCIQLIQRFYDPQEGGVYFGGVDVKTLNVKSLREEIGVVSQEPVLFDASIKENIRYGRLDVSDEQIYEASKMANCFDFIERLPKKWETQVGEGGATLSGGQKQRVAIARALVRNPKILLLDEATSALDTESEAIVQQALEKASVGRTTIVIAHRLSTIRNADKIIGFASGKIVEEGTHESLLKKENGVYANLVNMQSFGDKDKKAENGKSVKNELKAQKSVVEKDVKSVEDEDEDLPQAPWTTILKMNAPEWPFLLVGTIFSAIVGIAQPLFALIFAKILEDVSVLSGEELEDAMGEAAVKFVLLGVLNFVGNIGAISSFGKAGEELTMRIRSSAFEKLLRLHLSYFDDPLNSTGALATRLSTDASRVQGATGSRMALLTQNFFSLGFALVIAFVNIWQLAFLCLGFVPIMAGTGFFMMQLFSGKMAMKEQKAYENAGKIATEATLNIRTVASLAREKTFYDNYMHEVAIPHASAKKKEWLYGMIYGLSQGIIFFAYAATFQFGGYLIEKEILPPTAFQDIFKVLMAVVFGAMSAGQSSAFAPDFGEAKLSALRMIKLFNLPSEIDPTNPAGQRPDKIAGNVSFEKLHFTYPTRPDVKVLKGLSVSVKQGQTLALVGQSGCGKSTCIQLIQRFYNGEGSIKIDGLDINKWNLKHLRAQIGFVQQEPTLFEKTIKENILYGLPDEAGTVNAAYTSKNETSKKLTEDEMVERACKEANAFNFISELPSKYETNCGKKGSQLSGGQKQRIAIARALIREPKILLLDEATSALDAESEKIVQDALDKARAGRTCILIAHRLSTVISADKIAVVDNGVIIETGTHDELIKQQGAYFSLINSQL